MGELLHRRRPGPRMRSCAHRRRSSETLSRTSLAVLDARSRSSSTVADAFSRTSSADAATFPRASSTVGESSPAPPRQCSGCFAGCVDRVPRGPSPTQRRRVRRRITRVLRLERLRVFLVTERALLWSNSMIRSTSCLTLSSSSRLRRPPSPESRYRPARLKPEVTPARVEEMMMNARMQLLENPGGTGH